MSLLPNQTKELSPFKREWSWFIYNLLSRKVTEKVLLFLCSARGRVFKLTFKKRMLHISFSINSVARFLHNPLTNWKHDFMYLQNVTGRETQNRAELKLNTLKWSLFRMWKFWLRWQKVQHSKLWVTRTNQVSETGNHDMPQRERKITHTYMPFLNHSYSCKDLYNITKAWKSWQMKLPDYSLQKTKKTDRRAYTFMFRACC